MSRSGFDQMIIESEEERAANRKRKIQNLRVELSREEATDSHKKQRQHYLSPSRVEVRESSFVLPSAESLTQEITQALERIVGLKHPEQELQQEFQQWCLQRAESLDPLFQEQLLQLFQQQLQKMINFFVKPRFGLSLTRRLLNQSKKEEALKRSFTVMAHLVEPSNREEKNYSQFALLKNINAYLKAVNKAPLSEVGYCHGMSLLWLAMKSLGLENWFYQMRDIIILCPLDRLLSIAHTITLFLKCIDAAQAPSKYGNKTGNFKNIAKIIGAVKELYSEETTYNPRQQAEAISTFTQENNMFTLSFWWYDPALNQAAAHTVAVYIENAYYHFFDCNHPSGHPLIVDSSSAVIGIINKHYFKRDNDEPRPDIDFFINVVKRKPSPRLLFPSSPTLFGCRIRQEEQRKAKQRKAEKVMASSKNYRA